MSDTDKVGRIIIAGGRDFDNFRKLESETRLWLMELGFTDFKQIEVVSGNARGADMLGERFAHLHRCNLRLFPADWKAHGRAAGPIRNREMADYATHCICFWDGESRGTKNMIDAAEAKGLPVKVVQCL